MRVTIRKCLTCLFLLFMGIAAFGQRQMEFLNRGLIALPKAENQVFISWRILGTDPEGITFRLERKSFRGSTKNLLTENLSINNYIDTVTQKTTYYLTAFQKGKPISVDSLFYDPAAFENQKQPHLSIPLQVPKDGVIDGKPYSYSANDASVGDLDGDGQYEIILKWQPSNAQNPPRTGLTGNQLLDAYTLDGKFLWRIDLGINIRSGAAYTQFLVYDFDGNGKAEIICKTADGTVDGTGKVLGDAEADWRNHDKQSKLYGKIATGPEYITVFDGQTGAALDTKNYTPSRFPLDGWGGRGGNGRNDNTASRADRFSAAVAYLDGRQASALMVRGWYGRTVVSAWDFDGKQLNQRWVFDSKDSTNPYSGMANHNLTVADVDQDGKDELCVGAMTVDDNGEGLYTTGLRHGDTMHLSDLDPDLPGLEVYGIHESEGPSLKYNTPGVAQFDAKTGKILWSLAPGLDVGRGVAADIDPTHRGFENWGGPRGIRDVKGQVISEENPRSTNFLVWWDGHLTRELLDHNRIEKWNWQITTTEPILVAEEVVSNNGTKATPCLTADLLGDWREEVIWRTPDSSHLYIYSTTTENTYPFHTLMHDPQYRLSIAWQNSAYNQPPHTGFYLGAETKEFPKPKIYIPER